jgi:peptidoglycan hydrolase-like protein with peptidoglycan-binding domain
MAAAPLHVLVTRQTQRDKLIGVQHLLSAMGYLAPQNFDGTFGKATVAAIEAFQKANGLPENGAFTDELVQKIYQVAGKSEPPEGHLFVRQGFSRAFDAPIAFRKPNQPLGTHIFTAVKVAPGDSKTRWMALSIEGGDAASALDRIEIPDDMRQKISERLTPRSSLIIADTSVDSAILPEGDDFLVWAKEPPAEADQAKATQAPAKTKQAKATPATAKPRSDGNRPRSAEGYESRSARRYDDGYPMGLDQPGLFSHWFSRR